MLSDREVVDKTAIGGVYDVRLELTRAEIFPASAACVI